MVEIGTAETIALAKWGNRMSPAFGVAALDEVKKELGPDENLVWNDRPDPFGFAVVRWKIGLSTFLAIYAAQVFHSSITNGTPIASELQKALTSWLSIATLAVIACVAIWRYFEAGRLTYFLTDRRAGKVWTGHEKAVWSLTPNDFSGVRLEWTTSNLGNVIFHLKIQIDSEAGHTTKEDGFFAIRNSDKVAQHLLKMKHELGRTSVANPRNPQGAHT